jgi:hypothetical protein
LARKIEVLAKALRDDPEARELRIFDHASVISSPVNNRPTVADYLSDLAETVTAKSDVLASQRFDRKQSLKSYALKVAFDLLSHAQDDLFEAPNRATELLVSALLDQDIPPNTVAQMK